MSLPDVTISEVVKDTNQIKTHIGVGSVVKTKVVEMDYNTMNRRNSSMSKELVGCVQAMVENNTLLVKFEDGQNK